MIKIFDADFRTGSVAEKVSGIQPNSLSTTNLNITRSEKGLATRYTSYAGEPIRYAKTLNGTYTVVLAIKIKNWILGGGYISDFRIGGGTGYIYIPSVVSASSGTVYINNIQSNILTKNSWSLIMITGMSIITTEIPISGGSTGSGGANNVLGDISFYQIYYGTLTEKERASIYKEFLNNHPAVQEKYPNVINKPMDLSREVNNTIEQLPSAVWIRNSGTVTISGETITLSNDSDASRTGGWIIGQRYRITCEVTNYSGIGSGVITPYSSATTDVNGNTLRRTTNGIFTYDYIPTTASCWVYAFASSTGTIRIISIQKVTGLIAAYNMIPNGSTLVDISGNGYNGVVSKCRTTKKGLSFSNSSSSSITTTIPKLTTWSVCCVVTTPSVLGGYQYLFGKITNGTGFVLHRGTNTPSWRNETGAYSYYDFTANTSTFGRNIISLISNGTTISLYINGVSCGTITPQSTELTLSGIGGVYGLGSVLDLNGEMEDLRLYNRVITLPEIKKYHNEFVRPSLVCDFSDEGADGVSKVPSGWVKQSGAFKIGEFKPKTGNLVANGLFATNTIWGKSDATVTISGGKAHFANSGMLIGLNQELVLEVGKRYRIRLTVSNYVSGTIHIISIPGSTAMSANGTYIIEGVSDNTYLLIYSIIASPTTTLDIDDVYVEEIPPLKTFKTGTKYLECVTAGVIALPSRQAYGTWEFDWYKGSDSGAIAIPFIANTKGGYINNLGYELVLWSNEVIYLERTSIGSSTALCNTTTSYVVNNSWYRVRITRSTLGIFTIFIKGGQFNPTAGYDGWTLISTAGGSGTNPTTDNTYKSSEYFVLDIDAGDRIANIQLTDGIKQL